jgi:hypothetical protein
MDIQQMFIIAIAIMAVAITITMAITTTAAEGVSGSRSQCNPGSDSGSICVLPESGSLIVSQACGGHSGTGSDGSYTNQCGQGTSNLLAGSTSNNQYQSQEEEEEEYGDTTQSNELIQGSQAYQQCIQAAADVGDKLSDYEVRNCQEDPSYRH